MSARTGFRRDAPDPCVKFKGIYWFRLKGDKERTRLECPHKHHHHDVAAGCAQRPIRQLIQSLDSPDIIEAGWVVVKTGPKGEWVAVQ